MSIRVSQVSKLFGKQKALDQVSFEIQSGEVVGFLGPNGAGKSTMMKIITGFIPPTEGEVFVKGLDIFQNSLEARKMIGYLPENNPLYQEMYVKEYLDFVGETFALRRGRNEEVEKIIRLTGLEPERRKTIGMLSKGYRQRVGLAQALLHDPEVLILDEPTTGLDPNQIVEIRNLIREVGREKTVMLSTHIMQEVEAICDRVIIIHHGKIVMDGKAAEVRDMLGSETEVVTVEFNKPVDMELLKTIPGVQNILKMGENLYQIEGHPKQPIREIIFQFAVNNELVALSMQKKERKLEDIFRELTT